MPTIIHLFLYLTFIGLSTIAFSQSEIIFFEEKLQEPFLPNLVSRKCKIDTNLIISIIDGNSNGQYTDECNTLRPVQACDFLNVYHKGLHQQDAINFKPYAVIEATDRHYTFTYDGFTGTGLLTLKKNVSKPDLVIFNDVPSIQLRELKNLQPAPPLSQLCRKASTSYVFISFWASFCQPCLEDLTFYDEYEDLIGISNLTVIHVSIDEDYFSALELINKNNHTGAFYTCPKSEMEILNCSGYPNGFLMKQDGSYIGHFSYSSINGVLNYLKKHKS